jgi:hypothetical protein
MMLLTTMIPVIFILAIVYFIAIRKLPEKYTWISYTIVVIISVLYFLPGGVHFAYMGIENFALGVLLIWAHYRFGVKRSNNQITKI